MHLLRRRQDRDFAIRRKAGEIHNGPRVWFQGRPYGTVTPQVRIHDFAGDVKDRPPGPVNDDNPEFRPQWVWAQLDFNVLGLAAPVIVYAPLSFLQLLVEKVVTPVFPRPVCRELKAEDIELDEGSDTG